MFTARLTCAALGAAALLGACRMRSADDAGPADASADADAAGEMAGQGEDGRDDGGDAMDRGEAGADSCVDGDVVCDGDAVRICAAGRPAGAALETCGAGDVCSSGRCTSAACAAIEARQSAQGCLFYTLDPDNTLQDDPKEGLVVVANLAEASASVRLERRAGSGLPWLPLEAVSVPVGRIHAFTLADSHHEGSGLGAAQALRVSSDQPITAVALHSDDSDGQSESAGATLLLPAHVLGHSYRALAAPQVTTPLTENGGRYGPGGSAGQVSILGTRDGTHVTFTPSPTTSLRAEGGVPARGPGETFSFTLDDGCLFQLASANEGDDLSGSLIESDRPVAVFSGNVITAYGKASVFDGMQSADMTHEQMPPVAAWGRQVVAARLPYIADCPNRSAEATRSIWRIVAAEDATTLTFDAPAGVIGLPAAPVTLDAGRVLEVAVVDPKTGKGDFVVTADRPILVGQFMACEPSLSLGLSVEQLQDELRFVTPPRGDHLMALVRKAGSPVVLDGLALTDALWSPVGAGFEVTRLNLRDCSAADPTQAACAHRVAGARLGVTVRGQGFLTGYTYEGSLGVTCLAKPGGAPCRR